MTNKTLFDLKLLLLAGQKRSVI